MKKLVLLLSVAFIAACGGSGGGGSTTTSGTPAAGTGATTKVTFNIVEPKTTQRPAPVLGTEPWRRIVVTNPSTGYKETHEWKVGDTPQLDFELYPTAGYSVEVLDYNKSTSYTPAWVEQRLENVYVGGVYNHQSTAIIQHAATSPTAATSGHKMVNYGGNSFNLTDTGVDGGSITITMGAVAAPTITYPVTKAKFGAYSGVPSSANKYGFNNLSTMKYQVRANFAAGTPLNTGIWGLKRSTDRNAVATSDVYNISGNTSPLLTGPYATTNNTYTEYAMGLFYAKDSLLKTGEGAGYFVLPSAAPVSSPVVYKTVIVTMPNP